MVDQGALPSALVVVDDFLEKGVFAEVLARLCEASSQPADEQRIVWLQPAVAKTLRTFTNRHHPSGVVNDDVENTISVQVRVHYGPHHDHVDVTPDGNPVDGCICVVYMSGTGTLIFTEQALGEGEPIEHRIEVRPNRAVMWQNRKYSHRVETDDNCGPRTMLGPFTVDSCGNFISTGANQIVAGIVTPIFLGCLALGLCCCALLLQVVFGITFAYSDPSDWNWKWIGVGCISCGLCACICICCKIISADDPGARPWTSDVNGPVGPTGGQAHLITNAANYQQTLMHPTTEYHPVNRFVPQAEIQQPGAVQQHVGSAFGPMMTPGQVAMRTASPVTYAAPAPASPVGSVIRAASTSIAQPPTTVVAPPVYAQTPPVYAAPATTYAAPATTVVYVQTNGDLRAQRSPG